MVLVATVTSLISTATAVIGALIAILGALGYQNRRARLSAIRAAFNDVVGSLASADNRQQLAAAVLLRRFFDEDSELASALRRLAGPVDPTVGLRNRRGTGRKQLPIALAKQTSPGLACLPSAKS